MPTEPSFEVTVPADSRPGETLVIGLSSPAMAGLTAVDYLVRHLESESVGAVVPDGLPAITPFEAGVPRHHTRIYDVPELPLAVLVGELYVPPWVAQAFAEAVLDWIRLAGIEEIVVLHGVPFPHAEQEHAVFYVGNAVYRERRLDETDIPPLAGGVLDGTAGELVTRSLGADDPAIGVFITPAHPPGPDVEAALLLIEALETTYGFDVDEAELEALSAQLNRYHTELAERMEALGQADQPIASRDFPEDRMYM